MGLNELKSDTWENRKGGCEDLFCSFAMAFASFGVMFLPAFLGI